MSDIRIHRPSFNNPDTVTVMDDIPTPQTNPPLPDSHSETVQISCQLFHSCQHFADFQNFLAQANPNSIFSDTSEKPRKPVLPRLQPSTPVPLEVSKLIHTWGGNIELGSLKLEIPPNSLAEDTTLLIERIPAGDPNVFSYHDVYVIKPVGLKFQKWARVSFDMRNEEQVLPKELGLYLEGRRQWLVGYGHFISDEAFPSLTVEGLEYTGKLVRRLPQINDLLSLYFHVL